MRFDVPASTQARALPTRISHKTGKRNLKFQCLDPVTLFVAFQQSDLLREVDITGNPGAGFQITCPMAQPMDFLAFSGELFVTCNQNTKVEVWEWNV